MGNDRHISGPSVVVPAISTASSTAAIRSLGGRNIRTIAVSEYETPPASSSKYCDEVARAPSPTTDLAAYEATLCELAERPDVRTILPFRESDIYVLARNKQTLAEHVMTPWPSLETLQLVQDRSKLFDVARTAGVSIPETRAFDQWDDWDRDVIVKPRYTLHATEYSDRFSDSHTQWSSTRYIAPDEELLRFELVEEFGHVPLVQEYVPDSSEYGFFALYDRGEPVATFQHRQRRGWKYCGGPSAYRESVDIPGLATAGLALLDELDWHGVAMVEFLRDPVTGEFKLMEVNPRFWSSLPFTVQAGVDFPYLYWLQATDQLNESDVDSDYDVGIAGHLLWGELLHLQSIVREEYPLVDRPSFCQTLGDVFVSVIRSPRFDYLSSADPAPFVRDLLNKIGTGTEGDEETRPQSWGDDGGSTAEGSIDPDLAQNVTDGATTEQEVVDVSVTNN